MKEGININVSIRESENKATGTTVSVGISMEVIGNFSIIEMAALYRGLVNIDSERVLIQMMEMIGEKGGGKAVMAFMERLETDKIISKSWK